MPALRLFYLQELPSPIIRFHEGIDYFRTPPSISCKSLAPAIAARAPQGNASPSEGRPLRFLSDGTGMGASLNLPDGHLISPRRAYTPASLPTPTVVRDRERGNLAGWLIPARSALSCGVWCVWVAYLQCRSGYATRF